jgi:hypothetical protein
MQYWQQKQDTGVEAKNLVSLIGHLRDERSQWCNRLLRTNGPVAGFAFGERESEEKEEVMT